MSGLRNLKELEQYDQEHFVRKEVSSGAQNRCVLLNLLPGQEIPTHGHSGNEVLLLAQKGQSLLTVDGITQILLQPGSVYSAESDSTFHLLNNGTEPCQILVILVRLEKIAAGKV